LEGVVHEVAPRVGYLEALSALREAHAILLFGSSERHYTPSKLYPALLAKRPIVAVYHESSTAVSLLRRVGTAPTIRLHTFDERRPPSSLVDDIVASLEALTAEPRYDESVVDQSVIEECSARSLARKLAGLLDEACTAAG
jgi:hypothetical protein